MKLLSPFLIACLLIAAAIGCLLRPLKSFERRRLKNWADPSTTTKKMKPHHGIASVQSEGGSPRIVAFGTSKTWGAGLMHPEFETYVALLSPTALNLGLRSTPADYPSLCLYSMIGDRDFDVVILEFSPFSAHHLDFERLGRRIRSRFPLSTIIYVPIYMLLSDVSYQGKSLQKHLTALGIPSPKDPLFEPTIRSLMNSELKFPNDMYSIKAYHDTVASLNGHVIEFPVFHEDIKSFVLDNAKYYTNDQSPWDFVHPSVSGHRLIAEKIQQTLSKVKVASRSQNEDREGHWLGGKDRCLSWFSGFNTTDGIPSFTNMELINFQSIADEKWTLEVDRNGGTLSVSCSFPNCHIYISYMATRPSRFYPRVLMSVNDQDPILVDPYIAKFHLRKIVHVGVSALPGMVKVSITPIAEDSNSPQRFRITGVITTPTQYTEFG